MSAPLAVLDVGASNLRLALGREGAPSRVQRSLTDVQGGPEAVTAQLVGQIRALSPQPERIGVAIFGLVQAGRVTALNTLTTPGWDDYPLQERLEAQLGLPVLVMNDALAATLGEYRRGAGRGATRFLYLTVSTGIGAGLALGEGPVLLGAEVGYTSERGHWIEHLSSGSALARLSGPHGYPDTRRLCDAAERGDQTALALLEQGLAPLAGKLADLCATLAIERVALGGSVGRRASCLSLLSRLMQGAALALKPRLMPAQLGDEAGLLGMLCALNAGPGGPSVL